MACCPCSAKPLSDLMLTYCQSSEQISVKYVSKFNNFSSGKWIWKCCLHDGGHFATNVFKRQSHHSSKLVKMGTGCNFDGTVQITGWYLIKCVYWHSNQNKNITSFHLGEHLMLNDWCPRTSLKTKTKTKTVWTSYLGPPLHEVYILY